jgi:hypothetical protein
MSSVESSSLDTGVWGIAEMEVSWVKEAETGSPRAMGRIEASDELDYKPLESRVQISSCLIRVSSGTKRKTPSLWHERARRRRMPVVLQREDLAAVQLDDEGLTDQW